MKKNESQEQALPSKSSTGPEPGLNPETFTQTHRDPVTGELITKEKDNGDDAETSQENGHRGKD